jgi:hypothetical protein
MGNYMTVPFPPVPASGLRIDQMTPNQLWSAYIRYTGAGAVLAAGLITLARTIPTIVSSFRESVKDFGAKGGGAARSRTERDMPMVVVLAGTLLLAIFLAVAPGMPTQGNILAAALVVVFGFFFVTVSSRIVGLIGSSSNPVSGMTIATLILTCTIFVSLGWTGDFYAPIALCVGAVVCIAAANAGATSQDLKTGYIVGATPVYQQYGLIIGVLVSALIIGYTTIYLHQVMTVGSDALPAPQATLMSTIIRGLLSQNLPWGLVLVGICIAITLELCGIHSLSFAVGSYLPIATTAPIFAGGLVRAYVEKKTGKAEESEVGSGTLFSSGLIAGGSLAGILYAVLYGNGIIEDADGAAGLIPALHDGTAGLIAGGLLFFALGTILASRSRSEARSPRPATRDGCRCRSTRRRPRSARLRRRCSSSGASGPPAARGRSAASSGIWGASLKTTDDSPPTISSRCSRRRPTAAGPRATSSTSFSAPRCSTGRRPPCRRSGRSRSRPTPTTTAR